MIGMLDFLLDDLNPVVQASQLAGSLGIGTGLAQKLVARSEAVDRTQDLCVTEPSKTSATFKARSSWWQTL
jgi:hypothetical protein